VELVVPSVVVLMTFGGLVLGVFVRDAGLRLLVALVPFGLPVLVALCCGLSAPTTPRSYGVGAGIVSGVVELVCLVALAVSVVVAIVGGLLINVGFALGQLLRAGADRAAALPDEAPSPSGDARAGALSEVP
jgi:hypothetical protein